MIVNYTCVDLQHCIVLCIYFIHTQDEENEVFRRDFGQATLEDHFDKTVLPKVMQVKDFGRAGRTKYTHLVDQDTTEVSVGKGACYWILCVDNQD